MTNASSKRESTQVARGAIYNATSNFTSYLLSLAFYLALVRLLPVSALGVYYSLVVVITFATTFSFLSLPGGLLRFTTGLVQNGRFEEGASMFRRGMAVGSILTGISGSILVTLTPSISTWLFGSQAYVFLLYLVSIDFVIVGLNSFLNVPLYAKREFGRIGLLAVGYSGVRYAVSLILLFMGFGINALVFGWIASDAFYFTLFGYFSIPFWRGGAAKSQLRGVLAYSFPLLLSTGIVLVLQNIDRLFVLKYLGVDELGIYGTILIAAAVPQVLPNSVGASLSPALFKFEDSDGLPFAAVTRSIRYISIITIPTLGLVAALGRPLVDLVLGGTFSFAWVSFGILTLGYALMSPDIPLGIVLMTKKRTKVLGVQQVVSSGCLAIFAVILIPIFFLSGAALAYVLARLSGFVFILPFLHRLGYFKVEWREYAKILGSTLVTLTGTILIESMTNYRTVFLPAYLLAGVGLLVLTAKAFHIFRGDDHQVIMEVIPPRLRPLGDFVWRVLHLPTPNSAR